MTCQCQHPRSQTLYVMCSAGMYMYLHKHRACTPGTSLIPMLHHGMGMGLAGQVELLLNHMWYYQVTGNCSGDERIRSIDESTTHDEQYYGCMYGCVCMWECMCACTCVGACVYTYECVIVYEYALNMSVYVCMPEIHTYYRLIPRSAWSLGMWRCLYINCGTHQ